MGKDEVRITWFGFHDDVLKRRVTGYRERGRVHQLLIGPGERLQALPGHLQRAVGDVQPGVQPLQRRLNRLAGLFLPSQAICQRMGPSITSNGRLLAD